MPKLAYEHKRGLALASLFYLFFVPAQKSTPEEKELPTIQHHQLPLAA